MAREYWNYSTDHLPTYPENIPVDTGKLFRSRAEAVREAKKFCKSESVEFDDDMIAKIDPNEIDVIE